VVGCDVVVDVRARVVVVVGTVVVVVVGTVVGATVLVVVDATVVVVGGTAVVVVVSCAPARPGRSPIRSGTELIVTRRSPPSRCGFGCMEAA
jgi:hypothetical protein